MYGINTYIYLFFYLSFYYLFDFVEVLKKKKKVPTGQCI